MGITEVNAKLGKVTYFCRAKGCGHLECIRVTNAGMLPVPSRVCPSCVDKEKVGVLLLVGVQQWSQGYDKNQTYMYQCAECGDELIEEVTLKAIAYQHITKAPKIGLGIPPETVNES